MSLRDDNLSAVMREQVAAMERHLAAKDRIDTAPGWLALRPASRTPAPREIVSDNRRAFPGSVSRLMVQLETERLLLRDFEPDDWPVLHAVESRADVARYQSFEPRTSEESRAYVLAASEAAAQATRDTFDLAVILIAEGRLIGRCGLGLTDANPGEAMLWYTIHPSYWARGYATEAAHRLLDFGFGELGLHRIWADCDPANVASVQVLEKLGMRREGHLLENVWIKGAWADSLIYAILDREWTAY